MADFKVRVVENIGEWSEIVFGKIGAVLSVTNGHLIDTGECAWENGTAGFPNISVVNEYFSDADTFQTVFELVDEPC